MFGSRQGHARTSRRGYLHRHLPAAVRRRTGKSAQIPLYVWLPDAMAGPTPVSALIHAATMVTAGVYMVSRSAELFMHSRHRDERRRRSSDCATAVMAATIGLVQNDIKKVYAYSTVSQLGYMFLGVRRRRVLASASTTWSRTLLQGAALPRRRFGDPRLSGEQDMRNMGGLRKKIPITFFTLLCAALAIAGFPFTSGCF